MHIFLTGGTGYIGGAVMAQALAQGHRVTALVRSDQAQMQVQLSGAEGIIGDLATPEHWAAQATRADVILHLACSFDAAMAQTEPRLIHALAAHAGATPVRLIYTGGVWLFGCTGSAVAHEASPLSPIAGFQWAADAITQITDSPAFDPVIVHPGMVYDETGTRWPLVHRDDLARAYVMLATDPQASGVYTAAAQQGVSADEITTALIAQKGLRVAASVLPEKWVLARHGAEAQGPMLDQQMGAARLRAFGWDPQVPDFAALRYSL